MEPIKPTSEMDHDAAEEGNSRFETDRNAYDNKRLGDSSGRSPQSQGQRFESDPDREHSGTVRRPSSGVDAAGPNERAASEEVTDPEGDWYQFDFIVSRSLRYHAKRRSFFERCNHFTRAVTAIFGAGTVISVLQGWHPATVIAGIVVGVTTALDLVFDFSNRAMTYDGLYRRFADLAVKVANSEHTIENLRLLRTERLLIEKEEPTVLLVLNAICYNEELKARGFGYKHKVRAIQNMLCEILDVPPLRFERVAEDAP